MLSRQIQLSMMLALLKLRQSLAAESCPESIIAPMILLEHGIDPRQMGPQSQARKAEQLDNRHIGYGHAEDGTPYRTIDEIAADILGQH